MRPSLSAQRGYVLLLMLTAMGLGALFFLANASQRLPLRGSSASRVSHATADALRQAKEALIGYAATYPDEHSGETFGYLPTPDMGSSRNRPVDPSEGQTGGNFVGNALETSAIGRLPWQRLRLPPLKDEYGECLWYAVSGSHQQGQKSNLQTMNWDAVSYLDVYSPDGLTSLSGGNPHNRAVAVIFSAGPPIPGQNRTTSADDNVALCGGNYDARNYLDPYASTTATNGLLNWFAGSTNNASTLGAPPPANPAKLLGAPLTDTVSTQTLNDRAVFITAEDIFKVVRQRSDFIQTTLTALHSCLLQYAGNDYPPPALPHASQGHLETGSLPAVCSVLAPYANHFFYLSCTTHGICLQAHTPGNNPCKAAVIFGGARTTAQRRSTLAERSNAANYLEAPNLDAYDTAASNDLQGNAVFVPGSATTDVIMCLN